MLRWLFDRRRPGAREVPDPVQIEVLLDGVPVAVLSDRVFTDMFWRSYRIDALNESPALHDDDLWARCRFSFRDATTGAFCEPSFAGGRPPFVRDGRVHLRVLYVRESGAQRRSRRRSPADTTVPRIAR